jgi:predicted aconitase with swiveling domain
MTILKGKPVFSGRGSGPAMKTKMPINFTASFTKPKNILPWCRSQIQDRHHDLFSRKIKGSVLIFPAAIGSTYTGMVLLELMYQARGPAAIIVQHADSLLVSGPVLAEIWFKKGIPVVEYPEEDIYDTISTGDWIEVNGETGKIELLFKQGSKKLQF